MRGVVCLLVRTLLVAGLLQCSADESILRVHDGRLTVLKSLLLHAGSGLVAVLENLLSVGKLPDVVLNVLIVLKELYGKIARRELLTHVELFFQMLLHVLDAVLYLMAVVDVDVTEVQTLVLRSLVSLNDGMEEFLNAHTGLEHRRHHRNAEEL